MRSGELAAAAGVNAQTLRCYERRGLLTEPDRALVGHRLYPEQACHLQRKPGLLSRFRCRRRPLAASSSGVHPSTRLR
ncbi:MerR family DNA-binding transcriptional regulator [Nocardia fluminea]|uniref:MerR family DNA-binding transcriptional regulator n=1 Tax=Nocardia fluminea TaxID=134984 RepID=UPI00371E4592